MTNGTHRSEEGDDVVDRFRRADPAAAHTPDLAALRAATDRRIADPAFAVGPLPEHAEPRDTPADRAPPDDDATPPGSPGTAPVGSPGSPDDDDAPARAGRRTSRSGWVVAAAVATMLAVGTGGYIAGSYRDTPVVVTDSGSRDYAVESEAPQQQEADAFAEDSEPDADGPSAMQDGAGDAGDPGAAARPVQFIDDGLPTEARQGEAWIVATDDADAEPVLLGEYPVIPAADAVARLSDPRFTAHLWPRPAPGDRADPPPIPSEPGEPLAWPVQEVRLVAAELTVGGYAHGDNTWMLPTWVLTDDQGQTWSVLAVTEDALDTAVP